MLKRFANAGLSLGAQEITFHCFTAAEVVSEKNPSRKSIQYVGNEPGKYEQILPAVVLGHFPLPPKLVSATGTGAGHLLLCSINHHFIIFRSNLILTSKDRADFFPTSDSSLRGELTKSHLQEKHR